MTTLPYNFAYQPTPDRARNRAAAFRLLDAEDDPAETLDGSEAGDTVITVNARVSVFPPGAFQPRNGVVQAVAEGRYLVHVAYGGTRWYAEQEVTLRVAADAWEVESEG